MEYVYDVIICLLVAFLSITTFNSVRHSKYKKDFIRKVKSINSKIVTLEENKKSLEDVIYSLNNKTFLEYNKQRVEKLSEELNQQEESLFKIKVRISSLKFFFFEDIMDLYLSIRFVERYVDIQLKVLDKINEDIVEFNKLTLKEQGNYIKRKKQEQKELEKQFKQMLGGMT